jgi:hypothetical protein
MPIVPAKTWVAGDPILASEMNTYISGILTSLMNPPSAKVYRSAVQALPNNVLTEVLWTHELWDTAGLHSTVSNTGRLTVPQAGIYVVSWYLRLGPQANVNHYQLVRVLHNGAMVDETMPHVYYGGGPILYAETSGVTQLKASVGDYFQLQAYQNSGAASNIDVGAVPTFAATWIGNG